MFGMVTRIFGFALFVSFVCMSVIWLVMMFVQLSIGVDIPPAFLGIVMCVFGVFGAILGGAMWAVGREGVKVND